MAMAFKKIALVTGANRGIGFEIVRQLAIRGVRVYLAARSKGKGLAAAEKLRSQGLDVEFIVLDVSNRQSILQAFREFSEKESKLDILINNAAILIDRGSVLTLDQETLQTTMVTNVYGPLQIIQTFHPLIPKGGRIINISSGSGSLTEMNGYAPAYSISKTALNAITRLTSIELNDRGVTVNSMCPGWVRTDMGGEMAPRSVEQGADTAVWLALDAPSHLTGRFFRDRAEIPW
ncbi:SDR family oxidoreductase [Calditrichota bacterium GD2]